MEKILEGKTTETRNLKSMNMDSMSIKEVLILINEEDKKVPESIQEVIPEIEKAVKLIIEAFNNNGRLVYMGAGTSGRLGVLDAVECPPTFGVDKTKVMGLIAGGEKAFVEAQEGAEDSKELAIEELNEIDLRSNDIVCGIAASGRTPYVIGGIEYAKKIGCKTIAIACNKKSKIGEIADVAIEVEVGPEVLTGSTRMKAGTAQKLILNMISTASMTGIGKVYENLMVDLKITNIKLRERAKNNIMQITGCSYEVAQEALEKASNQVKVAIIMILLKCNKEEALERLNESKGFIREAVK
ncbi:N-acetylmuramic acid 6-phosphate etherase [Cetobacterium somerae]|uniref:N-acetylmuramic acid 6-phosphate etherase n=1 Tax=Cetobacterium sp. NK01 TaxID=2993530 RepID=UPI002116EA26|nr:N-acetylmuramic acid 6-phosphate etherase [Cetobacterium sp. NK01]MCQ8211468.1 N-acetylmuramic acid 6-phosphate etherase [Cetobacterium sp. NK01]